MTSLAVDQGSLGISGTAMAGALPNGSAGGSGFTSSASPKTAHPTEWTFTQVIGWLQSLQPSTIAQQHASKFREHEIEGDILLQLDADALRDMGITSIGHRLVILRGIYDLKRKHNVELEADDWRPDISTVEVRNGSGSAVTVYSSTQNGAALMNTDVVRALQARDERLWALEDEVARLVDWLRRYTDEGGNARTAIEPLRPYLPPAKAYSGLIKGRGMSNPSVLSSHPHYLHSAVGGDEGGIGSGGGSGSGSSRGNRTPQTATAFRNVYNNSNTSNPSIAAPGMHHASSEFAYSHSPHGAPGNVSQIGFSPTTSTPGATPTAAHPPISISSEAAAAAAAAARGNSAPPPLVHGGSAASGSGIGAGDAAMSSIGNAHSLSSPPTAIGAGTAATLSPSSPFAMSGSTASVSPNDFGKRDKSGASAASAGASATTPDTPYKSFRVTLDDPCYKVLPAALKKYKINDDWRQYALFICYGSTERCLSYDEKPLLLFQKLKENKQSPVFMLRHIRDVKSPIAIASAKAAARKSSASENGSSGGKTPSTSTAVQPASGSVGGKVADAVAKFGGVSGKEKGGNDSAYQNSDKEQGAEGDSGPMIDSPPGQPRLSGPAAQLGSEGKLADAGRGTAASASASGSDTYAIAIYPYVSEREDEFDVSVGDTFVVKSKAKGWWVVQRDAGAKGQPTVEGIEYAADGTARNGGEIKSGWVPAGCLLETRQPLSTLVSVPQSGALASEDPTSPRTPQAMGGMQDAQRNGGDPSASSSDPATYMANVPIPPSLITSTSTPGILLMDYDDEGEKLHLKKDQRLRVFKRYNHWSYCVEEGGQHTRAWLPSWYIGKVAGSSSRSASAAASAAAAAAVGGANNRSPQSKPDRLPASTPSISVSAAAPNVVHS